MVGASSFPRHWIYDANGSRIVSYPASGLSAEDLRELAAGHHREDQRQ